MGEGCAGPTMGPDPQTAKQREEAQVAQVVGFPPGAGSRRAARDTLKDYQR